MKQYSIIALLGLSLGLSSCFPSNIIAPDQRQIVLQSENIPWRTPLHEDLPGLYMSSEINGGMASVLRSIVYLFDADGSYTAAALFYGPPATFQVLNGAWNLEGDQLQLDDATPGLAEWGMGSLRISGSEGSVILQRQ